MVCAYNRVFEFYIPASRDDTDSYGCNVWSLLVGYTTYCGTQMGKGFVAYWHRSFLPYIGPCAYTFGVLEQQGYVSKVANDLDGYSAYFLCCVFVGSNLLVNIPIPYIENKLMNYEKTSDTMESSLNVFGPLQMFTILVYMYLMYFMIPSRSIINTLR